MRTAPLLFLHHQRGRKPQRPVSKWTEDSMEETGGMWSNQEPCCWEHWADSLIGFDSVSSVKSPESMKHSLCTCLLNGYLWGAYLGQHQPWQYKSQHRACWSCCGTVPGTVLTGVQMNYVAVVCLGTRCGKAAKQMWQPAVKACTGLPSHSNTV